jgi:large subunit ribosomal protein L10
LNFILPPRRLRACGEPKQNYFCTATTQMAITKDKKKEILAKLASIVKDSASVVFVNFHGLKVADSTAVRRKLKGEKVQFFVAKKTLIKKALTDKGVPGTMPDFTGELGVAYGEDLTAPAREIYESSKKYKDGLSILGGVFEGKFMSKEEMTAIAAIPPMKTLQGMFVNVINSPIQGLVISLSEIAKKKTA